MTDMSLAHRNDFLNTVGDIMDDPTFKAFLNATLTTGMIV